MELIEFLRIRIENLLFEYWEKLPIPKKDYTDWFYDDGRKEIVEFTINCLQLTDYNENWREK